MPEEIREIKRYAVDFRCPKCKKGYLRHTGTLTKAKTPRYPHACNNEECDYKETFGITYPYQTTEKPKSK